MSGIEVERSASGIVTLWLSNPGRLNALSNQMVAGLVAEMTALAGDASCRAVVLRGRQGAFCAGRDLNDLAALQTAPPEEVERMYDLIEGMNRAIYFCPKPVVSVVERVALGIGTMIAGWADIVIAEETAKLGFPEVRHGIAPYGAVPSLLKLMRPRDAADLLLSGRTFDAHEAMRLGLVSRAVPAARLEQELEETLTAILAGKPGALEETKRFLRHCEELGYEDGIALATKNAKAKTGNAELKDGLGAYAGRRK
ncbi:enoyl-CoA hydratase/isomerase family protein [Bosea caraganae]|uniref:Enoyl-CoA hydratase/isomerase family protein n=1 Tax=Bosea caraganae TaxID=2763117 RepID=A0A370LDA8_9HYPH|nr:enoyl-CoA hydratase/isomerase family protein [Bosea caraganae]RDJ27817.1 enoyl-CoA hydratase/isomerase family protein [Bosea caraganae]RDJ29830.1 enoyl-CoA hydratase/isomerase family protein [Bosea caraganae]